MVFKEGNFGHPWGNMRALLGVWEWSRLLKGERSFAQKGDCGEGKRERELFYPYELQHRAIGRVKILVVMG